MSTTVTQLDWTGSTVARILQARRRWRQGRIGSVHVAVDDWSRAAFVQLAPDEGGATAARVLLAAASFFV